MSEWNTLQISLYRESRNKNHWCAQPPSGLSKSHVSCETFFQRRKHITFCVCDWGGSQHKRDQIPFLSDGSQDELRIDNDLLQKVEQGYGTLVSYLVAEVKFPQCTQCLHLSLGGHIPSILGLRCSRKYILRQENPICSNLGGAV